MADDIITDRTVTLRRAATEVTPDLLLWVVIRKSAEAISFANYSRFVDLVLCGAPLLTNQEAKDKELSKFELTEQDGKAKSPTFDDLRQKRFLPYNDVDAYRLLKIATEAFLMVNCGVAKDPDGFTKRSKLALDTDKSDLARRVGVDETKIKPDELQKQYLEDLNGTPDVILPYLALIRAKLSDSTLIDSIFRENGNEGDGKHSVGIIRQKLTYPCFLELIWSYWHEEAMLVQAMNAICMRFQNIRSTSENDPLVNLEIDPLRPLNNLLWGYIQDEQHRLSVTRRAYEYNHHYGMNLVGKALSKFQPADSRTKFLEAFHNLLHIASTFFKEDDDTTVIADGFPLLNALKDVHLQVSEAHNQVGDMPWTARIEMLMMQWLLSRPEFREFLPTRIMVAYPEPWMDRVEAMKKLQGWTDTSVLHFRNLGVFGEQILLSIRFGAWSAVNDRLQAVNWARYWREEIQGYVHAYRAVTSVDLTSDMTDVRNAAQRYLPPAVHLRNRLAMQLQKR